MNRSLILFFLLTGALSSFRVAALDRVGICDLSVQTGNPEFENLGKGLSEIIAYELQQSKAIQVVSREIRNQTLKGMNLPPSDQLNSNQLQSLGNQLQLKYLLFGEIIDHQDELLITVAVLDLERGEIIWEDHLDAESGIYNFIGSYFAWSIAGFLEKGDRQSDLAELEKEKGNTEAVIALSEGLAAMDSGDTAKAETELRKARDLDPESKLIEELLSRLYQASSRLKVFPEYYVSYFNPAYLGGLEKDRLSLNTYLNMTLNGAEDSHNNRTNTLHPDGTVGVHEELRGTMLSYAFPVRDRAGVQIDYVFSYPEGAVTNYNESSGDYLVTLGNNIDSISESIITAGYELTPQFSLGGGLILAWQNRQYYQHSLTELDYRKEDSLNLGGILAFMLNSRDKSLRFDSQVSFSSIKLHSYDHLEDRFQTYSVPLYTESTLTRTLKNRRTLLSLKQINDIYFDRDQFYGRLMPAVEHWFSERTAIRLGIEGTLLEQDGLWTSGYGGTAGFTLNIHDFYLDINYTARLRPSYVLDDTVIPEGVFFFTLTRDGLFKR